MMKKKRILVGGGAGYIGCALVPELVSEGHDVHVVDLMWFGNHLPKNVKVTRKDLTSIDRDTIRGFDVFVFLAGVSNDPMAHFNPRLNFQYNAALPAYLAYEARLAGASRFIYGSSCSVYGNTTRLCRETTHAKTIEPYGISKLQGEWGVLQNKSESFSTIVLRQGTVCGYSPRMRFDLVVNTMIKSAMERGVIVVNNEHIWRPICSMADAVQAYKRSISADLSVNGVFNIASGNYQIGTVARKVRKHIQKVLGKKIGIEYRTEPILRNYRVSLSKSKSVLKFLPKSTIDMLITDILRNIGDAPDFSKAEYYNIEIFRKKFI